MNKRHNSLWIVLGVMALSMAIASVILALIWPRPKASLPRYSDPYGEED